MTDRQQTTEPKRLTMSQQRIVRDMQAGRSGPSGITNSTASALERRGLLEWKLDLSRARGGEWALTKKGKEA